MKWIDLNIEKPSEELMIARDILILREDGSFSNGVFYYDELGNIERMSFMGTGKCIELWKYKPTHWLDAQVIK